MYIQHCIKGIGWSRENEGGFNWQDAKDWVESGNGIYSSWCWKKTIWSAQEIVDVLTEENLDRHLHDYARYKYDTPFISLACGAVEPNAASRSTFRYPAKEIALMFATDDWSRPGALFYLWVPTSHNRAVALSLVAEPVRDINIYRRWSPYQLEGEVTAKIHIPANQIEKIEWWNGDISRSKPEECWVNQNYVKPDPLSNIRMFF